MSAVVGLVNVATAVIPFIVFTALYSPETEFITEPNSIFIHSSPSHCHVEYYMLFME